MGATVGIDAPAPVRDRDNPLKLEGLNSAQQREVDNANLLVERSVEIAKEITKAGGSVIFENPCDRGDNESEDSIIRDRY